MNKNNRFKLLGIFYISCLILLCSSVPISLYAFGQVPSTAQPSEPNAVETESVTTNIQEDDVSMSSRETKESQKDALAQQKTRQDLNITEIIPAAHKDRFEMILPIDNQWQLKDNTLFKGINRYVTPTIINGQTAKVHDDGRFYIKLPFTKQGLHHVLISFFTPTGNVVTLKKTLFRFHVPSDFDQVKEHRREIVLFWNSQLLSKNTTKGRLSGSFTRMELAYFLSKIGKIDPQIFKNTTEKVFIDVPSTDESYPAIDVAVRQGWMFEFPDGAFKPNQSVSKLEYILGVVKALDLEISTETKSYEFSDIEKSHWSQKYIAAAVEHNIISQTKTLHPNKLLSRKAFTMLAVGFSEVKRLSRETLLDPEDLALPTTELNKHYVVVSDILKALYPAPETELVAKDNTSLDNASNLKHSPKSFILYAPSHRFVTLDEDISVEGKLLSSQSIQINGLTITPNDLGLFQSRIPLEVGEQTITFNTTDETYAIKVYRLTSYEDLKGHWMESTAAKLRFLGYLEHVSIFEPQQQISKAEFSYYLSQYFSIPQATKKENIKDVAMNDIYYDDINNLIQANILSLDINDQFIPNKYLTRAEVIVALIRAGQYATEGPKLQKQSLPFKDIKKGHWASRYLKLAIQLDIVTPSDHYYPSRKVTKSELVSMFSKTPHVKERLDTHFLND